MFFLLKLISYGGKLCYVVKYISGNVLMDIVNVLLRKVRSVEEIFIIKFLMEEYVIGDVCDVDDNNIDVDIDVFGIEDFFLDMLEYMLFIILM